MPKKILPAPKKIPVLSTDEAARRLRELAKVVRMHAAHLDLLATCLGEVEIDGIAMMLKMPYAALDTLRNFYAKQVIEKMIAGRQNAKVDSKILAKLYMSLGEIEAATPEFD